MSEIPRLRQVPLPGQPERPLESWKEIAAYLNRTVRTARRWEETEGLPVHRHAHHKRDSVFAYESELDAWWNNRRARLDSERKAAAAPAWPRLLLARGRLWLALGLVLAAGVGIGAAWLWRSTRSPAVGFVSRDWVLVADFNNQTGNPLFDNSLAAVFTVGLQQSAHVNVLPPSRVADVLRRMGRETNAKLDEQLGREVCLRENAKALILGDIARIGDQYAVSIRVVDPQTGETVRAHLERAKNQEAILDVLGGLVAETRRDLGESLGAIRQSDRPLPQVTTPSLQALQLFAEGRQAWRKGAYQDALRLYESALKHDDNFVMAHAALGSAYCSHIFSNPAKGREHYERALQASGRITERERLLVQAGYQSDLGKVEDATRLYRLYLQSYPDDAVVRYGLGSALMRDNRPAEAIAEFQEALRIDPRYASAYVNLATSYNLLGRSAEALPYYAKAFDLEPAWVTLPNLSHEYGFTLVHAGNLSRAREVFELAAGRPDGKAVALRSRALLDMYQGKYREAEARLREAILLSEARQHRLRSLRDHIYLALLLEGKGDRSGQLRELDRAADNLIALPTAAAWASARLGAGYLRAGAVSKAEGMLRILSATADAGNQQDRSLLHLLEGEITAARGDPSRGIELLTLADREAGTPETIAALAAAHETYGKRDDATLLYQRLITMGRQSLGWEAQQSWIAAHVRVAEAYLKRGDTAQARGALDAFARLWSEADRDLPLVRAADSLRSRLSTANR